MQWRKCSQPETPIERGGTRSGCLIRVPRNSQNGFPPTAWLAPELNPRITISGSPGDYGSGTPIA
jgi:hypothetical protein